MTRTDGSQLASNSLQNEPGPTPEHAMHMPQKCVSGPDCTATPVCDSTCPVPKTLKCGNTCLGSAYPCSNIHDTKCEDAICVISKCNVPPPTPLQECENSLQQCEHDISVKWHRSPSSFPSSSFQECRISLQQCEKERAEGLPAPPSP